MSAISTIFFDIGGVCLSNGWDHEQRQRVAGELGFDYPAFDARHRQVVDSMERGLLDLDDYLAWTVFYEPRAFTVTEIVATMQKQSSAIPGTLDLVRALKQTGRYSLMTINNESRELNEYRIARFGLRDVFSAFFSSCYLGLIKPQPEHYRRALEISQRTHGESLFVDDRPMNVDVARILGMQAILFTGAEQLERELRALGVEL